MEETDEVRRTLPPDEVDRLFSGAVDEALAESDRARLQAELAADAELKLKFEQYSRAVNLLRSVPKATAPDALASVILRRARRRRFGLRAAQAHQAHRFPAEVIVPILIAALVALFFFLASP